MEGGAGEPPQLGSGVTPRRARLIAAIGYWLVRAITCTLRFHVDDRAGVAARAGLPPVVWAFWHNRLFIVPQLFARFQRRGAALTRASKDGELLAAVLARFGVQAIRGSSSRRGAAAWRELRRAVQEGWDVGITPDGPRGPRYNVHPGLLLLAQKTGAPILPLRIRYSGKLELKSWDGFQIPLPFARVDVVLDELVYFEEVQTAEQFEEARAGLEALLRKDVEGVSPP